MSLTTLFLPNCYFALTHTKIYVWNSWSPIFDFAKLHFYIKKLKISAQGTHDLTDIFFFCFLRILVNAHISDKNKRYFIEVRRLLFLSSASIACFQSKIPFIRKLWIEMNDEIWNVRWQNFTMVFIFESQYLIFVLRQTFQKMEKKNTIHLKSLGDDSY